MRFMRIVVQEAPLNSGVVESDQYFQCLVFRSFKNCAKVVVKAYGRIIQYGV